MKTPTQTFISNQYKLDKVETETGRNENPRSLTYFTFVHCSNPDLVDGLRMPRSMKMNSTNPDIIDRNQEFFTLDEICNTFTH